MPGSLRFRELGGEGQLDGLLASNASAGTRRHMTFAAAQVSELRERLSDDRLPVFPFEEDWFFGAGRRVVTELARRWRNRLDDEESVRNLAEVAAGVVTVAGTPTRAVHLTGESADALPIVLTHGWPSSVIELLPVARRLARPSAYGADAADAFHVVIPALPGFPLGDLPTDLEVYTAARMADRWVELMAALGYTRFIASGGDIGARVAAWLGARHPDRVIGIHVTANALAPTLENVSLATEEEVYIKRRAEWMRTEGAYMAVQQTKPLSLAFGLSGSPLALAAWVGEKWYGWSGGQPAFERIEGPLLDTLSIYWLTNRVATSFLPYFVYDRPPGARPAAGEVATPVSFYLCPNEIGGIPPRSYAERQYMVARWREFTTGGHFFALESPEELARDIRSAFRGARAELTSKHWRKR